MANTQVLTTDGSGNQVGQTAAEAVAPPHWAVQMMLQFPAETNDLIVYTGSGFENKMKHEIAQTVNFTKADGTAQLITLENAYDPTTIAGYMNDRVPQKYKMLYR